MSADARTGSIAMAKAHFPVSVLGPGRRIGLWTQGCSIRCNGCSALDTWEVDPEGGHDVPVRDLVDLCADWVAQGATGVTITGGEPCDQPEPLYELILGLRELGSPEAPLDVLCYSGRSLRYLQARRSEVLGVLDAVLVGPYLPGRPADRAWRGSANQELVLLTDLGRERWRADDMAAPRGQLQLSVEDDRIWLIGVPRPGDLDELESRLAESGLRLEDVSWRS